MMASKDISVPVDSKKMVALNKSNVEANIPSLRVSSPDSTGSKAAKKNNKYSMQNNYRQERESYYNAGTSSSRYYLNSQNSPREVRMLGSKSLDEKLSELRQLSLREDSELIIPNIPGIDYLMEVHSARYKQRSLDKILDHNRIVNYPLLPNDPLTLSQGPSCSSMNHSQQLYFNSLSDEELAAIKAYKCGVGLLELGYEEIGKEEFKNAADKGFLHAGYVYALMIFKEIVQHDKDSKSKPPTKKDINKAVQCMINIKEEFYPFPSFVLGMMRSYISFDKIFVNKKLTAQVSSARECLYDVLRDVRYSEGKYSLTVRRKCVAGEGKSEVYLKWVVQSTKYELARGIFLDKKPSLEELSSAKSLLKETYDS